MIKSIGQEMNADKITKRKTVFMIINYIGYYLLYGVIYGAVGITFLLSVADGSLPVSVAVHCCRCRQVLLVSFLSLSVFVLVSFSSLSVFVSVPLYHMALSY
jgi:hypothetical protein